jgi:magnesium transporter
MVNPHDDEVDEIVKKYDFHEIIEEDLKEENTHDKIDAYDDYVFLVLHFPKFNERKEKYY